MTRLVHQLSEHQITGPQVVQVVPDLVQRYRAALERLAPEPVHFDVFMFPLPTEQVDPQSGAHQLVAMIGFYLQIAGPVPQSQISGVQVADPLAHDDEFIERQVTALIGGLLEYRELKRQQDAAQLDQDGQEDAEGIQRAVSGLVRGE
jgi:hypothetical protein